MLAAHIVSELRNNDGMKDLAFTIHLSAQNYRSTCIGSAKKETETRSSTAAHLKKM